jgi:hypothetical protein
MGFSRPKAEAHLQPFEHHFAASESIDSFRKGGECMQQGRAVRNGPNLQPGLMTHGTHRHDTLVSHSITLHEKAGVEAEGKTRKSDSSVFPRF